MPNVSQMLNSLAREQGVDLAIVQQDYAISYLLVAIAQTAGLGEKIVLKGGTALKKLYYPNYRFSEDLDYSTLKLGALPKRDELLQTAVTRMAGLLQERGPFDVQVEPLILRQPHPGQQIAYTVRVRFPDQRQALCRLKVEITVDEPVFLEVREHPILHNFEETIETGVLGYALEEIVAEKLRALLQSRQKLAKRGWGASRVCRDYYDLWYILGREKLTGIPELFAGKCRVRKVAFHSSEELISPSLIETARREWDQQLSPFLATALKMDKVIAEVQTRIQDLF
ncbi:MAG: nucleotidyl transferase AbiEii/AbiGii toxin family protein [Chloroflexi bacterium]|nr:nucleotidyl transferase AbiEii/AbiGii toxin family protein [Chloroflexota bacterium]